MRLGQPAKTIDQSWFTPTIPAPSLPQLKSTSQGRPIDLSLGDQQCLHDMGCPDCLHHLRETPRTVRVGLKTIGRIDATCLSIGLLRDPTCIIRRSSDLVSNESAKTTDREQWRLFSSKRTGLHGLSERTGYQPGLTL